MMFDPLNWRSDRKIAQLSSVWVDGRAWSWLVVASLGLAAILPSAAIANPAPQASDRPTPSGLPVPRYVSLKYNTTNARVAPGDDMRLLWVYRVKGLPVQVIAETREWRRICDPDGGLSWVHKRLTDGRRTALRLDLQPVAIHKHPNAQSPVAAYLKPRALASLDRCENKWCRIEVDKVQGWVPSDEIWGANETPQCRTSP
jgi:SH3-like domain-containing protein